ncbi:hypothetical protein LCGC14_3169540 [marine sediment metagenome]|uniref:Uncharacterized protein n=1 Tax=marine sediment metagenome TaxID=412755 RepID=A0A0F8VEE8_9ZZZZ
MIHSKTGSSVITKKIITIIIKKEYIESKYFFICLYFIPQITEYRIIEITTDMAKISCKNMFRLKNPNDVKVSTKIFIS